MKIFFIIYGIISLLWGIYALFMQKKHLSENTEFNRMVSVFVINVIAFPFALYYAIKNRWLW